MTENSAAPLSAEETARYQRQIMLPEAGTEGQRRLKQSRVCVVGAGGLGSPAAMYLAAAGIGTLGLIDADSVDLTNLQRQILHGSSSVGSPKTASAAARLEDINPHCRVEPHRLRLTAENAEDIFSRYDMVLGCVDNLAARDIINTACVRLDKPNIFGSVSRFAGQASVFCVGGGPCWRCFFREPPPDSGLPPEDKGILGPVPGVIGSIQATESIKYILKAGEPLAGRLLLYDALTMRFREIPLKKDPRCPVCGTGRKES